MEGEGVDSIVDADPDKVDDWADGTPGIAIRTVSAHETGSFKLFSEKSPDIPGAFKFRVDGSSGEQLAIWPSTGCEC
jgi:hypothetical protein